MPFRRKKPPSAEGDDAEENAPDALAAATNYLSFQDATATGIADDVDDLGDAGSAAVGVGGRLRGWFGGRRSANNGSNAPQQHRGFSTSIHDMFQSPETERIDCCALTCCGMMQSDRDRYFLQGVTPPSLIRRLWLHLLIPVWLLAIAGWAAMRIRDPVLNQVFTTSIVVMLICYFMTQCSKGRSKRIEIRKDLLWTKAQLLDQRRQNLSVILEQERPDDDGDNQEYYLGQTQLDFGMAHPCCLLSCYSEDRLVSRDDDEERPAAANMCASLWEWTCPPCCGMHIQCCGVCALAQEGREVETALLPRSYLRVDYITMQPYADYYPAIYQARHQERNAAEDDNNEDENGSSSGSAVHLSRLSIQLLQILATLVAFVILWTLTGRLFWKHVLQANIPAWRIFGWEDFCVFVATWLHSIAFLALLVWLANRPKAGEVSMDALIKFFAAGFCLATALAVFWELVLSIIIKLMVQLGLALAGVDTAARPDSQQGSFLREMGQGLAAVGDDSSSFLKTYGQDHPIFYTLYLLLVSFVVAAGVEEMCKYFSYRMVEHPDFISRRETEESMQVIYGEFDEEPDETRPARHDFSKQRRSLQAHGAAVTIAMVAVAMGFACCENLVYVFIYSGSSFSLEASVLFARALFPVHPLAAALQSINVVARDVEGQRPTPLGRILGPAVLFHGGYDFLIMWINFLAERNGIYEDQDGMLGWADFLSFFSNVLVLVGTLFYFLRMSRRQRQRLAAMDQDETMVRSNLL